MQTRSAALLLLGLPAVALAQMPGDTVRVSAGAHYAAGGLHRWLFGQDYRDLWATPVRVPVLNLRTFAGGLTPTTAGGGQQTLSLRFRGQNGQEYGFRSIDKDPDVLPDVFTGTFVERVVQDQISSAHPAGPAVTAPLMEAAGIFHTDPTLVVLPDDPALGEFRDRFRGALGFIEERAITGQARPFAGATEIVESDVLFPRLRASAADRVDARSFLRARLFDQVIGDWDRHDGQWGWARFQDRPVRRWMALPEDRDQAFVRFDGLLLSVARVASPQLVNFGERYPGAFGLNLNARDLDRLLLSGLERAAWDSTVAALQTRLTDELVRAAVGAMPPEYRAVDSARLARALLSRRDALPRAAGAFYRMLVREAELHGTDEADLVEVARRADGTIEVAIGTVAEPTAPYVARRFDPAETSEVRLYLHGGNDRVVVRGASSPIRVRISAGPGADDVVDSSGGGPLTLYSSDGDPATGRMDVDRRAWTQAEGWRSGSASPRDWGARAQPLIWLSYGPDVGMLVGAGAFRVRYGFRNLPFASRLQFRAGWALEAQTGRAELASTVYRSNSRLRFDVMARASGIEVLNFHGFGNATLAPGPKAFYRVNHSQFMLAPAIGGPLGGHATWALGPSLKYSRTADRPGRFLATLPPLYGAGEFGLGSVSGELRVDTRDVPGAARRGVFLRVAGRVTPAVWDVTRAFSDVEGEAATYWSAGQGTVVPTLALRAGGRKVWGAYPFQESAFLGGKSTVRLGRENRFAGDAAVFGNAELRLQLAEVFLLLPGHVGLFGLGDAGRVFYAGDPAGSGTWHSVVGGGVWVSLLTRASTGSVAVVRGDAGRLGVYVGGGFAF